MTSYSVVIPVYNSEGVIEETVSQVCSVAEEAGLNFEIILVNDGSTDGSWHVIKQLTMEYCQVVAIDLIKNYGQHNALLAGFQYAHGDYVITMDDDLQNPPMEIMSLIAATKTNDADLIIGKFIEKKHPFYRRIGSYIVGYLNKKIFNKPSHITLTNFRIIRQDLVKRVMAHQTAYPYLTGILQMYAANIKNVTVAHDERQVGRSNYSLTKIMQLVSRILINYSSFPLRCISSVGLMVSLVSFFFGGYYLIVGLIRGYAVPGWTTLVVLLSFLCGFIIALLGLIGEYLSRILDQLSHRPNYIVKEIARRNDYQATID